MFWTIVGAILFVFIGIPILIFLLVLLVGTIFNLLEKKQTTTTPIEHIIEHPHGVDEDGVPLLEPEFEVHVTEQDNDTSLTSIRP